MFAVDEVDGLLQGSRHRPPAGVAERIRTRVEQLQLPNRMAPGEHVTVSIGAATALASFPLHVAATCLLVVRFRFAARSARCSWSRSPARCGTWRR